MSRSRNIFGNFFTRGSNVVANFGESGAGVSAGSANFTIDRGSSPTGNAHIRWNEALTQWEYGTDGGGMFPIGSGGGDVPLKDRGDMLTHDGVTNVRLPAGAAGTPLVMDATNYPTWSPNVHRINEGQDNVTIVGAYSITSANKGIVSFSISLGNQTAILPDALTISEGWEVDVVNTSITELLEIQDHVGTTLKFIPRGKKVRISLIGGSTSAGRWSFEEVQKHNILYVAKAGGDYASLYAAVTSIVDNSATNQYTIIIAPGTYTEISIPMKEYVSVVGSGAHSTVINGAFTFTQLIIAASHCTIRAISFRGADMSASSYGISLSSNVDVVICDCQFDNFQDSIFTSSSSFSIYNCAFGPASIHINNAIRGVNSNVTMHDNRFILSGDAVNVYKIDLENTASYVLYSNGDQFYTPTSTSIPEIGIRVTRGGNYVLDGTKFIGAMVAVRVLNTSSTPRLQANITAGEGVTMDIQHASMYGTITGSFYGSPYGVIVSPNINVNVSLASGATFMNIGDVVLGTNLGNASSIRYLLMNEPTLGRMSGGQMIAGTSRRVEVSAGTGYVKESPSPDVKGYTVVWAADVLFLPARTLSYVYVTNGGVVSSSLTEPDSYSNILLGRVFTDSGHIIYIDEAPINSIHAGNLLDRFNREAIKGIVSKGCEASGNSSGELQVSPGVYFFGTNRYTPVGGSFPITFSYVHHRAGEWVYRRNRTTVDDMKYDDGTKLVNLTANHYAKLSLYLVGEGANENYFVVAAQAQFATLGEAQSAPLPIPPEHFEWGLITIAAIIVQRGHGIVAVLALRANTATRV